MRAEDENQIRSVRLQVIAVIASCLALQLSASANLLRNGAFDHDTSGWNGSAGTWAAGPTPDSGFLRVVNWQFQHDVRLTGATLVGTSQCVLLQPNARYELEARARAMAGQAVGGYAAAEIMWYSTTNCSIRRDGSNMINVKPPSIRLTEIDGAWHDLKLENVQPPAGARAAEISLLSAVTDYDHRGDFEVSFDDIVFRVQG
jgi:hypothetical protein